MRDDDFWVCESCRGPVIRVECEDQRVRIQLFCEECDAPMSLNLDLADDE